MSKVNYKPLSRTFPKGHISEGQPTHFIEKIWESIGLPDKEYCFNAPDEYQNFMRGDSSQIWPKHHTIRSGNKVQVGDQIVFFCWSGVPYRSPWIRPFPPIEVKKVWDFEIMGEQELLPGLIQLGYGNGLFRFATRDVELIAKNDGLSIDDFKSWFGDFKKNFVGQVICWNDSIEY